MKALRMQSCLMFIIVLFFSINTISAQSYHTNQTRDKSDFKWPDGKKMGLTLTFDDGLASQVDNGIPILDKYGVKGTFYISPEEILCRLEGWKEAVSSGHDIGNHSMSHPCSGNSPYAKRKPLEEYSLENMRMEFDSANKFIQKTLGIKTVSFAYPCGLSFVGRGINTQSYVPIVASMFETGRGWLDEYPNHPVYCEMSQLTGMEMDGKTFEEILPLIELARDKGLWLILAGHDVKDNDELWTTYLKTIDDICKYASDPANEIWVDNVHNIAAYVNEKREK